MRTITLEDGTKKEISEELYKAIQEDPKPKITCYEDAYNLVQPQYDFMSDGCVEHLYVACRSNYPTEAISKREFNRKKLITLAHALNGDWKPAWKDRDQSKWSVYYSHTSRALVCYESLTLEDGNILFKDKETAEYAIEIEEGLFLEMFGVEK